MADTLELLELFYDDHSILDLISYLRLINFNMTKFRENDIDFAFCIRKTLDMVKENALIYCVITINHTHIKF